MDKIVLIQLQSLLNDNHILKKILSGFKSVHSIETALERVLNCILMTTDSGASAEVPQGSILSPALFSLYRLLWALFSENTASLFT